MAKTKSQSETGDRRGGGYFLLPLCLLESDAWRAASPMAIKLLLALCSRHNGHNNGKITLSQREAADAIGRRNYRAIGHGFGELHALGLAVVEADHPKLSRMAREYRLTFLPTKGGKVAATNEYVHWRPGDAGSRNFGVEGAATETRVSAEGVAAGRKVSAEGVAADGGEMAEFVDVSAATGSTHIINHTGQSPYPKKNGRQNASGASAIRAGAVSAAPPVEELRDRALRHLAAFGRGSQSRLAGQAAIVPGTFSRFLKGGPLNEQARIRLACAFPRAEAGEQRTERAMA
jgi:hypothetical protein